MPQLEPDRLPVVLVEDNRETAFVMSKLLESTEFQIIEAHSAERGLECVAATNPAAVILDVLMDGESSWNTLKQIRARNVPVISVSVVGSEQPKAIAMGASAFLHKPVSRDDLLKALRSITQRGPLRKVLLVEDNEIARYSLRELLGSAKLEIVEASSGREGLRLASEVQPDAIFLDLMMPDMSGIEVLKELRTEPSARKIPIVIHSSKDLSEDEKLDLRLPLVTFLPKRATSGPDAMDRIFQALALVGFSIESVGERHA
jgi:CheY-like chemotaxis protein